MYNCNHLLQLGRVMFLEWRCYGGPSWCPEITPSKPILLHLQERLVLTWSHTWHDPQKDSTSLDPPGGCHWNNRGTSQSKYRCLPQIASRLSPAWFTPGLTLWHSVQAFVTASFWLQVGLYSSISGTSFSLYRTHTSLFLHSSSWGHTDFPPSQCHPSALPFLHEPPGKILIQRGK